MPERILSISGLRGIVGDGLDPEYVELLELDGATILAAAVRVGSTRLIDNVIVKGALS